MQDLTHKGALLVLCAPSGAGKTTLARRLVQTLTNTRFSISHTTRAPRGAEENGKDYFFVDQTEFEKMIDNSVFLEWASVFDNYYGTSKKEVESALAGDEDIILDIDVQGAAQVKNAIPDAALIFILPPSLEELRRRLVGRGTDTEDAIQNRLTEAEAELARATMFDYMIINDDVDRAFENLKSIVEAERARRARVVARNRDFIRSLGIEI